MPRMSPMALAAVAAALLCTPRLAGAQSSIQLRGPQVYPGKSEVSAHLGYQFGLNSFNGGSAPAGFRLLGDYNFRFYDMGGTTLWLNVGFALTLSGGCTPVSVGPGMFGCTGFSSGGSIEPLAGLKAKFRVPIPLVPYARLDAFFSYIFNRYCDDNGFGFGARAAGGAKYFLTRNIGVGVETGFTLGPAIFPKGAPAERCGTNYFYGAHTDFYAAFDVLFGAEFAFNNI